MNERIHRAEILQLASVLVLIVAAPTVGDIGSCGSAPADIDAPAFFLKKAELDCARCTSCGFSTKTCAFACDPKKAPTAFPEGCYPIEHDGEVCLNALEATSCEIYASFVADVGATTPTECNFCPPEAKP